MHPCSYATPHSAEREGPTLGTDGPTPLSVCLRDMKSYLGRTGVPLGGRKGSSSLSVLLPIDVVEICSQMDVTGFDISLEVSRMKFIASYVVVTSLEVCSLTVVSNVIYGYLVRYL